jgi:hypothetical protein
MMSTSGSRSPAAGPSAAAAKARRPSRSAWASSPWTTTRRRISDVRSLGAAGLAWPQGDISPPEFADAPLAKLILYTNLEVIHHGAEISLLRDLYLWKDSRAGL